MLLTNRHNVTGRRQDNGKPLSASGAVPDTMRIIHNRAGKFGEWLARDEPLYSNGTPRWREHPHWGANADFVALPLTALDDVAVYSYDVANPGPPVRLGPAQIVSVVGFPFGIQAGGSLAVWATGFIASEPDVDFRNYPLFLIDCRSRPGQSGSAVIAYGVGRTFEMENGSNAIIAGEVIRLLGIYSGRINEQSDLGMVWKTSALNELIATIT